MKPLRLAVLTLSLLPLVSLAAPPEGNEALRRTERRSRMQRVLELAEDLELNDTQALKLSETMRQFDERRQPLILQVREAAQVLRKAANGDPSAQSQVDTAVQRAFDARVQIASLDHELYQALAQQLPPQQRAQLAIFLAHRKLDFAQRERERQEQSVEQHLQRQQWRQQRRGASEP